MGYFRFFFKRKVNYLVIFPISLIIILGVIYIYGTRIWYDPGSWLEDVQQKDIFNLSSISLAMFIMNLISFLPYIVAFYLACAFGYVISRIVVSFIFYLFRRSKKNLYYFIKLENNPLPEGFGYKLPTRNIMYLIYSAILLLTIVNILVIPFVDLGNNAVMLGIVVISSTIILSLVDYSHIVILTNNEQLVYTPKTFGKNFLPPVGTFKAHTTKFEVGKKGIAKKSFGTGGTKCPKCYQPLYGYGVVSCPNCKFNLINIICPICREKFTRIDEKTHCPKCNVMYHYTHLLNYVAIYKKCPNCHEKLSYEEVESYKDISLIH